MVSSRLHFPMLTVSIDRWRVSHTRHEAKRPQGIRRTCGSGSALNRETVILVLSSHLVMTLTENGIILQENLPDLAVMAACALYTLAVIAFPTSPPCACSQ